MGNINNEYNFLSVFTTTPHNEIQCILFSNFFLSRLRCIGVHIKFYFPSRTKEGKRERRKRSEIPAEFLSSSLYKLPPSFAHNNIFDFYWPIFGLIANENLNKILLCDRRRGGHFTSFAEKPTFNLIFPLL